tara:strand:- start:474 stop:623 length:150 start_codon:yes stop_codon:yes gene_type:complete
MENELINTDEKKEHWLGIYKSLSDGEKAGFEALEHIPQFKEVVDYCRNN